MDSSASVPADGYEEGEQKKKKKWQKRELAVHRARLAQERALLAWVRTATTLMTFGFALFKFLEAQLEEHNRKPLLGIVTPRMIGLTLLMLGFLGLGLSIFRHIRVMKVLDQYSNARFFTPALVLAYLIMVLIAILFLGSVPFTT